MMFYIPEGICFAGFCCLFLQHKTDRQQEKANRQTHTQESEKLWKKEHNNKTAQNAHKNNITPNTTQKTTQQNTTENKKPQHNKTQKTTIL
jgi:hypothetical protein